MDSNPSALLSHLTRKHLYFPGRCSIAHDFRSIQVNPRLSALCTRFHRSPRNFVLRWRRKRQGRYELIPENASFFDLRRRCRPEDTEDRDASLSRFDLVCCQLRNLLERGELDVSGGGPSPADAGHPPHTSPSSSMERPGRRLPATHL